MKTIAFIPHAETFEQFFDTINMSFDQLCNEVCSGWIFAYMQSIKLVEPDTRFVCIYFSNNVTEPIVKPHKIAGSVNYLLPTSWLYKQYNNLKSKGKLKSNNNNNNVSSLSSVVKDKQRIHDLPEFTKWARSISNYLSTNVLELYKILKQENVDIIVTQEYEYARFDTCVALGKFMNIPVYASYQGGNKTFSTLETLPRKWAMKNCKGLIIPASVESNRVLNQYKIKEEKIGKIFNPTDTHSWQSVDKSLARFELGLPQLAPIAVWHGRLLMHIKGLDILLNSWKDINKNNDRYLIMIGEGQDREKVIDKIKELNLTNITLLGFTNNRKELINYLSAADIYLFPSRHEGFALAPLEALSCGLPLVGAMAPGVVDTIPSLKDGGITVPIGDVDKFTQAANRLLSLSKDDLQELSNCARNRALNTFSPLVIGKQLVNFLNN